MAYFYGWTHDQLMSLDVDSFEIYWQAITTIEAQEMLKTFTCFDWPNIKKGSREKLHRQLYRQAYPASFKEAKQVSNSELAKLLGG